MIFKDMQVGPCPSHWEKINGHELRCSCPTLQEELGESV